MDQQVPVGVPHCALQTLEVLVYDYDHLGVERTTLRRGDVFQPWDGPAHWRGKEVPITFGDGNSRFDWGVTSFKGHFLRWDDFFERCAPVYVPSTTGKTRVTESSVPSPFRDLAEICSRLRRSTTDQSTVDEIIAKLEMLRAEHTSAAMSELAAMGFDNSDSARKYADEQKRILEEAREILQQVKERVEK